jgi:hypothetical protein
MSTVDEAGPLGHVNEMHDVRHRQVDLSPRDRDDLFGGGRRHVRWVASHCTLTLGRDV